MEIIVTPYNIIILFLPVGTPHLTYSLHLFQLQNLHERGVPSSCEPQASPVRSSRVPLASLTPAARISPTVSVSWGRVDLRQKDAKTINPAEVISIIYFGNWKDSSSVVSCPPFGTGSLRLISYGHGWNSLYSHPSVPWVKHPRWPW